MEPEILHRQFAQNFPQTRRVVSIGMGKKRMSDYFVFPKVLANVSTSNLPESRLPPSITISSFADTSPYRITMASPALEPSPTGRNSISQFTTASQSDYADGFRNRPLL